MSREERSLLDSVGDAASGAGSEALAAISNLGGGDAGGTVGRVVSAVFGKHGGFAPKVITSVTKHGIAGIERVEPLEGVDRGYRAVAADANGLESIRTIIELDPREYEVTVTREESAGVVEFVQQPKPEPEVEESAAVEPKPPVKQADAAPVEGSERTQSAADREQSVETVPVGQDARRDSVAQARAEAKKAKAEAEAEKARAEAETARAEAEAAKARARAEQARANAEADLAEAGTAGQASPVSDDGTDPAATPELDGGSVVADGRSGAAGSALAGRERASDHASEQRSPGEPASQRNRGNSGANQVDAGDVDPAFSAPTGATNSVESAGGAAESVSSPGAPLRTEEPLETTTVSEDAGNGETAIEDAAGSETTVEEATDSGTTAEDEFGSFVAARPVETANSGDSDAAESARDDGISRWAGEANASSKGDGSADGATADSLPDETGDFEF